MDVLGPIIIAFIVLVYYGLRSVFKPLSQQRRRRYLQTSFSSENEMFETQSASMPYDESDQGFAFNDPLAESTMPEPSQTSPLTTSTRVKPLGIGARIQKELRKMHLKASPGYREPNAPSPDSMSNLDVVHDTIAPESAHAPVSEPSAYTSQPYARNNDQKTQSKNALPFKQMLKTKLTSTHKKEFLREMVLMHEVLGKPIALRVPKETDRS